MISKQDPVVGEPPEREVDILRRGVGLLRERLPRGWSLDVVEEPVIADRRVDALVELVGPDRTHAVMLVEAKRSVLTRGLAHLLDSLGATLSRYPGTATPLLAARYLSPSARAWLDEHDVSYVDATGNLRVAIERPALYLRDVGAERDPWRGPGRPRGSLQGPPAARVVRALVDFTPPMSVPELARRSGASTGATYRVVDFLEEESLLERSARGPVRDVRWRRLIERWSQDYGFGRSNTVSAYLQPRGLSAVVSGLTESPQLRYVITGSLAAQRYAPYAPARLAMVYVDDPAQAAERLGLRPVDSGANTLLATGAYDVVFDRPVEAGGLRYAAPSQVAVDLLTSPGRGPAEGQKLLDWMEDHEHDWRH